MSLSLSRMTCLSGTNLWPCPTPPIFLYSFLSAWMQLRRSHHSYYQSYEPKTESVLLQSPLRRVDHTLLLIDKLHLSVLALLSDTIGEHNLLHVHVVDQLQCEDKSLNIYIFVLKLIYSLVLNPIVTAFSLLKMMSFNIDLTYWMAESFTNLCSLCLQKASQDIIPSTIEVFFGFTELLQLQWSE